MESWRHHMNCYEPQNRLVKCLFLSTELKKDQIKEKDTVMMSCGAEEFIFDKSFLSSEEMLSFSGQLWKVNSKEIMLCPIRRSGSIVERLQNLGWHFYGQLNTRRRFSIMFRYVKLLSVYFFRVVVPSSDLLLHSGYWGHFDNSAEKNISKTKPSVQKEPVGQRQRYPFSVNPVWHVAPLKQGLLEQAF